MPSQSTTSPLLAAAALVILSLTACQEPPPPEPALLTEPSALQVTAKAETHSVQLDKNGAPSDLEKRRLNGFVADLADNRPDAVHAIVRGAQPRANDSVVKLLAADGIDPSKIDTVSAPGASGRTITVELKRYDVTPPTCPSWSTGPVATNDNSTNANFGCANLTNFAAMVADPHDLIAGRSSLKGDAVTAARAVKLYHDDNVKPLPRHDEIFSLSGPNNAAPTSGGGQ